jgi:hypothetical protein
VAACSCNLEGFHALTLGVNVHELTWLYAERRAVDALTIYQDVAVNNHLTGL